MASPDGPGDIEPLGAAVARLRRQARLTGQRLGDMVGMSQTKISRLETGHITPAPDDLARILRALHTPHEEFERLVAQAEQAHNRMTDWRQATGAIGGIQAEVAKIEAAATEIRIFQPGAVVGLAQTSEYARAVLSSLDETYHHRTNDSRNIVLAEAVTLRVRRQEVLTEQHRRFHLLMGEAALSGRVVDPVHMLAQIERLRQLAKQENVALKIIPLDAGLPFPLIHGFELLDDKCVVIDVYTTAMMSQGRDDLASYRQVFDRLEESASPDPTKLLDKYRVLYRDLLD